MVPVPIAAALLLVSVAWPASAQEWIEYVNREDRFAVTVPAQPKITDVSYVSQLEVPLRGRLYTFADGPRGHYSLKVIDYTPSKDDVTDWLGSVAWEAWQFRKRPGQVVYDAYSQADRIQGHELHILNPDKSMTYASIYMHKRKLYVLEATLPQGGLGSLIFQQSVQFLDETGDAIRYELDDDGSRIGRVH